MSGKLTIVKRIKTFTANAAHSCLLWFLPHGEYILSKIERSSMSHQCVQIKLTAEPRERGIGTRETSVDVGRVLVVSRKTNLTPMTSGSEARGEMRTGRTMKGGESKKGASATLMMRCCTG